MGKKLEPCPFCGGEAEAYYVIDGSFACSCTSCSYASCAGFNTEQEAIAAWNTRAERTCMLTHERWDDGMCTWGAKCSECGARFEHETGECWRYCPNCGLRVRRDDE